MLLNAPTVEFNAAQTSVFVTTRIKSFRNVFEID